MVGYDETIEIIENIVERYNTMMEKVLNSSSHSSGVSGMAGSACFAMT